MKMASCLLTIIILGGLLPAICSGCEEINPIRIGFTAELTGKENELAISLRNGVQLAVEDINKNGGIAGRNIELLIEDDKGIPQGAREAENKLIDSGVIAIVGHLTSGQTTEGYPVAETRGIVLISATASTTQLTGKKDLFFCTTPSTKFLGGEFANYIYHDRGISDLAIIYDEDNAAYSYSLAEAFTDRLIQEGGKVTTSVPFPGKTITDFIPFVYALRLSNPEAVLIIASPLYAGIIAQQIRLQNWTLPLFAAPWARGDELLRNGGSAIEGLELIIAFDSDTPPAAQEAFIAQYQDHFAQDPAFTATYGYEVIQILATALAHTNGNAAGLADTLTGLSDIPTITGSVSLNDYGDTIRPLYIQKVDGGLFVTIKQIDMQ
ncbi:MAG: ABC transporter substrate-binding protein [Anaerolineaceae bacterium]|nr:ABC transporter substrate-binding protein [Anaerolineaceae bacterium]MBN2676861.1 ABC transporter substrate-binding protein [Anaerolineaceae bacterium]